LATEDPSTQKPSGGDSGNWQQQAAQATELPIVLVAAMLVGGGMGYVLDRLLHTGPWLMIILGVLGFGVGVRDVIRRTGKPNAPRKNGNTATKP
jgi:ATP synthase protein I